MKLPTHLKQGAFVTCGLNGVVTTGRVKDIIVPDPKSTEIEIRIEWYTGYTDVVTSNSPLFPCLSFSEKSYPKRIGGPLLWFEKPPLAGVGDAEYRLYFKFDLNDTCHVSDIHRIACEILRQTEVLV